MTRQAISTANAPAAVGPYSQAIVAGDLIFCAGQGAIDPATQDVRHGSIEEETERTLRNLEAVLDAAGAATRATPWVTADGARWAVGFRPRLPSEHDCADLPG